MTTTSALSSSPAVPSRTARATAQDLGAFVTASPSAFHAVQETARRLREAGFTPLQETDHWSAQDVTGDRYVIRDGSIIAWSTDRKSTRLNSSHVAISYAVFCLKKKRREDSHHH